MSVLGLHAAPRARPPMASSLAQRLIPRPSFFQLDNLRKARARGEPWHLIVHEDVLVFRAPRLSRQFAPSALPVRRAAAEPGSLAA